MRFRFASVALLGLAIALVAGQTRAAAAEKAVKPALVVRVASVDTLIDDAKYLCDMAGQEEYAKQIDGLLKGFTGGDGIPGLDKAKPIGMYGKLSADVTSSEGVLLLPVSKPKEFLAFLADKGIKPDAPKGGLYKVDIEGVPVPIFFRFANGYAYVAAANGAALDKEKLMDPKLVFAATPETTLSITLHLDEIPASLKKEFLAQTELKIEEGKKEEKPNESKAETALRLAATDETFALMKAITNEGGPVSLVLDIDRKNEQVLLSARFAGVPDSPLAARINRLSQVKSLAPALLGTDSALYLGGSMSLPDSLRKLVPPVFEEGFKKGLEKEANKGDKELAEQVLRALTPTIQGGELDAAMDFRGPTANGKYTMVMGVKVQDGRNLEKAIKAIIAKSPAEEKSKITLDFAKAGTTSIHKMEMSEGPDSDFQKYFGGNNVMYFAVREDGIFVTAGENALPVMKSVLVVEPKPGPVLRVELQMSRFATMIAKEQKNAPAIAKEVFKEKGSDRVSIVLMGGKEINLQVSMKLKVLAFFIKLNESKSL